MLNDRYEVGDEVQLTSAIRGASPGVDPALTFKVMATHEVKGRQMVSGLISAMPITINARLVALSKPKAS